MIFRSAEKKDLPEINILYRRICKKMNDEKIFIWDDVYPFDFFEEDIKNERLYILIKEEKIISGFVLNDKSEGEPFIEWENQKAKALYLERFGVDNDYTGIGIGSLMLEKAGGIVKEKKYSCLRLFVGDINIPAINLYLKNGFVKRKGIYTEIVDDDFILYESGFEKSFM